MTLTLSRPTCDFLIRVGESWGMDWMRALAGAAKDGTFTSLDGGPCMVEVPEVTSHLDLAREIQMRLGEEAA